MMDNVLPAVRLHHGNRLGHTTDSQLFLKEEERTHALGNGDRYQWWISRGLYESFKERDSFPGDVADALSQLEELGDIVGFEDYQILPALTLR